MSIIARDPSHHYPNIICYLDIGTITPNNTHMTLLTSMIRRPEDLTRQVRIPVKLACKSVMWVHSKRLKLSTCLLHTLFIVLGFIYFSFLNFSFIVFQKKHVRQSIQMPRACFKNCFTFSLMTFLMYLFTYPNMLNS